MYCPDSQVETLVFKSQGSLSNGYYTDLLQGYVTKKREILEEEYVYHYMDLYVPFHLIIIWSLFIQTPLCNDF